MTNEVKKRIKLGDWVVSASVGAVKTEAPNPTRKKPTKKPS